MHAGLMLSAHAHNIQYYGLVKVVNNASGTCYASKLSTDWNAKPYRIRMYYQYVPSLDLVQTESQWCFGSSHDHQEPYSYYNIITNGLWGLLALDTIKQQQKQIYRLRNVRVGYVLYRALVMYRALGYLI